MALNGETLKIISYNCNSIRSKVDIVRDLLSLCDILLCQEVILLEDERCFLDGICELFSYVFLPSTAPDNLLGEGRPPGGMVLYFRKSLSISIDIKCETNNFSVYELSMINSKLFTLINVYLPYDDRSDDSLIKYQNVLGELPYALDNVSSRRVEGQVGICATFMTSSVTSL